MNKVEYLLTVLGEEGAEVTHRASKAARFTPGEVQPGQDQTNAERLAGEIRDVVAVAKMLEDMGIIDLDLSEESLGLKRAKVESYMEYSESVGTLTLK